MNWQLTAHAPYLIMITMLSGYLSLHTFSKRRNSTAAGILSALFIMTALWTLFYMLELSAVSRASLIFANDIAYIPIIIVPVLLLIFIIVATGNLSALSWSRVAALFVFPLFLLILIWTSTYHNLYYGEMTFPVVEGKTVMKVERGMFFWGYVAYAYLCLFSGTLISFYRLFMSKGVYRFQSAILLTGTIIPWIGSVLDILFGTIGGIHMLQVSFVISEIFFLIGIQKFGMVDVSPIGRHVLVEEMEEMMLALNERNIIIDVNPSLCAFFGGSRHDYIGKNVKDAFSYWEKFLETLEVSEGEHDVIPHKREGKVDFFKLSKVPLKHRKDRVVGLLVVMSDVTERVHAERQLNKQLVQIKKLQEELQEQAVRDPLTGLYNRRFQDEVARKYYARIKREGGTLGLLFLDIDNFKILNDTYGHAAGDVVLKDLGRILKSSVRESDVVSRYGGEEFLILFLNSNAAAVYEKAEEMRQIFQKNRSLYKDRELKATFSAGVTQCTGEGDSLDRAIERADNALYEAKRSGRNRVVIAND